MGLEFTFDSSGLHDMVKSLEEKEKKLSGSATLGELFSSVFMKEYTDFSDVSDMFEASGYKPSGDVSEILDVSFNEFVKMHTKFSSWREMLDKAKFEYAKSVLNA